MNKEMLEEGAAFTPQFEKRGGLLPVIVQSVEDKEILMLGYANQAALDETIRRRLATFWSTSRQSLWTKGESSGDYLKVEEIRSDCDQDALIYLVRPQGEGACHTKNQAGKARYSCFYRRLNASHQLEKIEP